MKQEGCEKKSGLDLGQWLLMELLFMESFKRLYLITDLMTNADSLTLSVTQHRQFLPVRRVLKCPIANPPGSQPAKLSP
jgi:hypothetical protein